MLHHDPFVSDLFATAISGVVAFSCFRLWEKIAKRRLFDQVSLNTSIL
jgi:farnesol kinase